MSEVFFIGRGFDEALQRIRYAEPKAIIEVIKDGNRYTADQFKQKEAPVVFLIAYTTTKSNFLLYVGMDCIKGTELLGSWHFIGTEEEVAREIRQAVEEMGEQGNTVIRYSYGSFEELDDIKGDNIDVGELDFTEVRARSQRLKQRHMPKIKDNAVNKNY